ncbi:MAG: universal stress protein [Aquificae bacterium]|nr:universal stress protein [Aquificota bacterium]
MENKKQNLDTILVIVSKDERSIKALDWAIYLGNNCDNQSKLVVYYDLSDVYYLKELAFAFGVPVEIDVDEKEKNSAKAKLKELLKNFKGEYTIEFFYSGSKKEKLKEVVEKVNPSLTVVPLEYINAVPKYEKDTLVVS